MGMFKRVMQWLHGSPRSYTLHAWDPTLSAGLMTDARELTSPEVVGLFLRAKFHLVDPVEVLEELIDRAATDNPPAVFLGRREGDLAALAVLFPPWRLNSMPQVFHFFNSGGPALRDLMLEKIVAWARVNEYDSVMAFAVRGGPAWEKTFAAVNPKVWGQVYVGDVRSAEDGFGRRRRRE